MKIQNFDKPTEIKEMYLHLFVIFFENIKKKIQFYIMHKF